MVSGATITIMGTATAAITRKYTARFFALLDIDIRPSYQGRARGCPYLSAGVR
jgi:hypothetical protein